MTERVARAIAGIARDRRSGATAIARRAAHVLRETARDDGRPLRRWRADLRRVGLALAAAQPAMGSLLVLVDAAFRAGGGARTVGDGARAVATALAALDAGPDALDVAARRLARSGPRRGRWVTLSWSEAVLHGLAAVRPSRAIVAESRPGGEGRRLAARLRARGVPADVVPDLRAIELVATADAVVVGADAITPTDLWNKVGTRAVAIAAHAARVPFYAITTTSRLVPAGLAARIRPGATALFAPTPLALVGRVVTEAGVFAADDVRRHGRRGVSTWWT